MCRSILYCTGVRCPAGFFPTVRLKRNDLANQTAIHLITFLTIRYLFLFENSSYMMVPESDLVNLFQYTTGLQQKTLRQPRQSYGKSL